MDFSILWLIFVVGSMVAATIAFFVVIPSRIRKMPLDMREAAWRRYKKRVHLASLGWNLGLLVMALIIGHFWLGTLAFLGIGILSASYMFSRIQSWSADKAYNETAKEALFVFVFAVMATITVNIVNIEHAAAEAKEKEYDQSVVYHLDADNHKLEGDTVTYPITNLRVSSTGDTYSWVERKSDGTLAVQTVKKVADERFEVVIKDDLPSTDTQARVERTAEYKVKGSDIAAERKVCAEKYETGHRIFHILPECKKLGQTVAKFTKARTVIHIPAGSADKTLPLVD